MTPPIAQPESSQSPTALHPRLLHPLMGADIRTLIQVLITNGGVAPQCFPHVALAIATSIARWPFTAIEQFRVRTLDRTLTDSPPPIFIVGHWRSGTTFLYELLCQSSQFAYVSPFAVGLPWDFLTITQLFGGLLERSLPEDRFIDSMAVTPDSPQEDEIGLASMQAVSFYHGLYFPRHLARNFNAGIFFEGCSPAEIETWTNAFQLFLAKVQAQDATKPLLIKNPVYTARVALLRELYPTAKFIHIYRNPYRVFQSTRNFYWKLFKELSLQPFQNADVDALILNSYPRMMRAIAQDSASLPANRWIELRFEDFERDPVAHIQLIYQQLELEGFDAAQPHFVQYLESRKQYQKNQYSFSQADADTVYAHWHPFIDQWGYPSPTALMTS
ncbi:MAG: sulfotransferase [Leptolyngbyaceae bacterium]|nr:sulfotransferase [Leptolyngbyaceae bacterium]